MLERKRSGQEERKNKKERLEIRKQTVLRWEGFFCGIRKRQKKKKNSRRREKQKGEEEDVIPICISFIYQTNSYMCEQLLLPQ